MTKRSKIVEVDWADATRYSHWNNKKEAVIELDRDGCLQCHSAGYLLKETDDYIAIALSYAGVCNEEENVGQITQIPKSSIRRFKIIRR